MNFEPGLYRLEPVFQLNLSGLPTNIGGYADIVETGKDYHH